MQDLKDEILRKIIRQRAFLDGAIHGGNQETIMRESNKLNALINRFHIIENNKM